MKVLATFVLCAFVCTHAATISKRDVQLVHEISKIEVAPIKESEKKLTEPKEESQKPEENNSSAEELLQQTVPVDQVNNDLRSQILSEVHIPVEVIHETKPVLKADPEVIKDNTPQSIDANISENYVKPQTAQNDESDDEEEPQTPKPGFIQQGIQSIQALQQAAAISIQNALRPENDEQSGSGSNFFQQSITNLQNSFQNGIQSLNQTVSNFLNGNRETQQEDTTNNQNIISGLQQNFESSISQLNQTFQNIIHPNQGAKLERISAKKQTIADVESGIQQLNQDFQIGLKSASEGVNVITSVKQESSTNNTSLNAFQQFIQGWQQSFQTNIQSLNSTIQNFLNQGGNSQTQSDDSASNRPNVIQQGFQNFQQSIQNFQNFLNGQQPSQTQSDDPSNPPRPTNFFSQGLQQIQQIFGGQQQNIQGAGSTVTQGQQNIIQQGLQSLQQNFQNGITSIQNAIQNQNKPSETPIVTPEPSKPSTSTQKDADVISEEGARKKGHGGDGNGVSDIDNSSSSNGVEQPEAEVKQPEITPETISQVAVREEVKVPEESKVETEEVKTVPEPIA